MNRFEEKTPTASQHDVGWTVQRTEPLLSVAGEVFFLTFPLIERAISNEVGRCKSLFSGVLASSGHTRALDSNGS
jgi:hypothetical protein